MDNLIYGLCLGVLLCCTFANLCFFWFLFLKRRKQEAPNNEPEAETDTMQQKEAERIKKQFENLLNYNGTGEGQQDV